MFNFSWNPGVWIDQNWQYLLGWSGALMFLHRLYLLARRFEKYGDNIDAARADLSQIKANHLAHIQMEQEKTNVKLDQTNEVLSGLREDLRDGFNQLNGSFNVLFQRMP